MFPVRKLTILATYSVLLVLVYTFQAQAPPRNFITDGRRSTVDTSTVRRATSSFVRISGNFRGAASAGSNLSAGCRELGWNRAGRFHDIYCVSQYPGDVDLISPYNDRYEAVVYDNGERWAVALPLEYYTMPGEWTIDISGRPTVQVPSLSGEPFAEVREAGKGNYEVLVGGLPANERVLGVFRLAENEMFTFSMRANEYGYAYINDFSRLITNDSNAVLVEFSFVLPTGQQLETLRYYSLPDPRGLFDQFWSEPSRPTTTTVNCSSGNLMQLTQYWNGDRADNYLTSYWSDTGQRTAGSGTVYSFGRLEGYVFSPDLPPPPGTIPLTQYWNESRGDNYTTTYWSGVGHRTAGSGMVYSFGRLEGYIFSPDLPQPAGTIPLTQYWNANRADNYTTTNWSGAGQKTAGSGTVYTFGRLEGYVCPP